VSLESGLAEVDAIADRTFAGWKVPGVAYGVIVGGELRHSRGLGTLRIGEDAPPEADSVFRIASMTKSFTASTVLLLRDEGRVRLDDPIALHLPELAGLRGPTSDSPPITIRHLLTMTAGFPTDDPWGDRQQALDLDAFMTLVGGGLSFAWAPGTQFEYSNLGYGILGRLISAVAGAEYREVVADRFLGPLGMASTTYLEEDVPTDRLAHGAVWRDGSFLAEPMDGYGALASMGGIFSTVRDLTRWVAGFADAFPARDGDSAVAHPLSRASRREMQQAMVSVGSGVTFTTPDGEPALDSGAYGFGLFVQDHLRWGRVVGHSGGYPGFGSNMRWHPASGVGVVVLANGRYAPSTLLAREMHHALLAAEAAPARRIRPGQPTLAARAAVETLLAGWDEAIAERLFAMNVELDEPIERRRAEMDRLRGVHGALAADPTEVPESASPFHLRWWLRGEHGRLRVEILLSPELPPKVQALTLTSVPEPPAALQAAAARILAALAPTNGAAAAWPEDLPIGPGVEAAAVSRGLRAAEARFSPLHLGPAVAGDGIRNATFRIICARGTLDLAIERDPDTGILASVGLVPVPLEPPTFAD
jgi:CubicO group peptidase (beta-lactamase class C family)